MHDWKIGVMGAHYKFEVIVTFQVVQKAGCFIILKSPLFFFLQKANPAKCTLRLWSRLLCFAKIEWIETHYSGSILDETIRVGLTLNWFALVQADQTFIVGVSPLPCLLKHFNFTHQPPLPRTNLAAPVRRERSNLEDRGHFLFFSYLSWSLT